ncbi:MAG: hypothetical protein ACRC67_34740 [Inquilinus sp.]|uniref:hypothetical protein n=1 Tax=Inquilinus sp. TaxID=1932117 RepID=UPI003F3F470A
MENPPTNAGTVDNIADLKAITIEDPLSPPFKTVFVNGYRTPGDGGGGMFHWDPSDNQGENEGTIIKPDSNPGGPAGRWLRTLWKPLNVLWFGAKPDLTRYTGCAMELDSNTLVGTFGPMSDNTSVVAGMAVVVWGAGPGGTDLLTKVQFVGANQLTLEASAGTTVTNASAWIGTDNALAFKGAIDAWPRDIYVPPGRYGFQNLDDNGLFRGFGIELTQVGHRIFGAMPMDLNIGTYPFGSTHSALYAMGPISLIRNAASAGASQVVENLYLECLMQAGITARADANTAIGINFGYTGTGGAASRYSATAGLQCQIRGVAIKGFREGVRIGDPQIPTQSWGVTLDRVKCYANMINFRISDMGTEASVSGTQQSIATACTALQSDGRWLALAGRFAREVIGVQQMGGFWQWNQLRAESNHINFKLKSRPSGQQGQATLIQPSVEGAFSAIFEADSNVGLTVKGGYGSFSRGNSGSINSTTMVRVNQQDSQQNINPSNISIEDFQLTDGVWSFGDKPRVILFTGKGYGAALTCTVLGGAINTVSVATAGGVPGGVPLSGEGYIGNEAVDVTTGGGGGTGGAIALQVLNGRVVGATIVSGGSGYSVPPTLTIDGGSGARGTAVISGGGVASITPGEVGANYLTPPVVIVDNVSPVSVPADFTATVLNGAVSGFVQTSAGSGYTVGTNAPRTAHKANSSLVRIEAPQGVVTSPANVWIDRLICTDGLDMTDRIMTSSSTTYPRFAPKRVSFVAGPSAASFATPLVYEWADNRQGPTVIQGGWNNRPLADIGSEASILAASNDAFYAGYVGLLGSTTGFKTIATIVPPPNSAPSSSNNDVCGVVRIVGSCRYGGVNNGAANLIDWSLWYQRVNGAWTFDESGGNSGSTIRTGGPDGDPLIKLEKLIPTSAELSLQVHRKSAAATDDFYDVLVTHISTQPRTMKIGPSPS